MNGQGSWAAGIAAVVVLVAALSSTPGATAQLVAARPDQGEVPPGAPLFIDGIWRTDDGRRFKIEGGRMVSLSDYVDIMWQVKKGMVILTDMEQMGPREFTANDPGWKIRWTGELDAQRRLSGTWHGALGPVTLHFRPEVLANVAWFQQATTSYQQPGYQQPGYPPPGYGAPAPYPPPGYAQPGYPQPGYPQPGYPPQGYPQPGYPPQGYPQPMPPRQGGACAQTVYDVSRGHYVCVQ